MKGISRNTRKAKTEEEIKESLELELKQIRHDIKILRLESKRKELRLLEIEMQLEDPNGN